MKVDMLMLQHLSTLDAAIGVLGPYRRVHAPRILDQRLGVSAAWKLLPDLALQRHVTTLMFHASHCGLV